MPVRNEDGTEREPETVVETTELPFWNKNDAVSNLMKPLALIRDFAAAPAAGTPVHRLPRQSNVPRPPPFTGRPRPDTQTGSPR
jgi:hypothetical protein